MTGEPGQFRQSLIDRMLAALAGDATIDAIFEGGSAATGRLDAFSDTDWFIVAPLARADEIFDTVERVVDEWRSIVHRWNVDPVGFPNMVQRFYLLRDAPRFFMLDCAIVAREGVDVFLERERHGEPVVYFDRCDIVRPRPIDRTHWAVRRAQRVTQLRGMVPIYDELVAKELARSHGIEAFGFYQVLVRALIEVIGMRERPDRFDFGWRYVETELSADAQRLIGSFAFVADARDLDAKRISLVRELHDRLGRIEP